MGKYFLVLALATVAGLVCDYFDKCNFTCSFSNELQQMSEPDIETYLLGFNFSQKEVRYLLEMNYPLAKDRWVSVTPGATS